MPYNVSVEANESRGVLLFSASRHNLVIVGKLPSLWDSRPAIRFDTDWQTQRGHFAMMGVCVKCQRYTDVDENRECKRCVRHPSRVSSTPVTILKALIWKLAWGKQTKTKSNDWREMVYMELEEDTTISREDWLLLKYAVIKRDKQKCQRCDRRFKMSDLSAHHIVSRADGGSNDMTNLITLCNPCHDFVEGRFSTRPEIIGSHEKQQRDTTEHHEPVYEAKRPNWHQYVYGGRRHSR